MRYILLFLYFFILTLMFCASFIPDLFHVGYNTDKMLHIYVVCFALLWPCLSFQSWRGIFLFAFAILCVGCGVEGLQTYFGRNAEFADVIANITGISIGLLNGYLLRTGYRAQA